MARTFATNCDSCVKKSPARCELCATVLLAQVGLRSDATTPCGKQGRSEHPHFLSLDDVTEMGKVRFHGFPLSVFIT